MGLIRRISAVLNYAALGRVSTLVTAQVGEELLAEVIEAVNSLENVSHNYLRKHRFNLWFTLGGASRDEIDVELTKLTERFDIDFHSLPVVDVFKLDVRFDAEGRGELLNDDVCRIPQVKPVKLKDNEKRILSQLQGELEITARPFDYLRKDKLTEDEVIGIISGLSAKGVIRRIGAIVDYRRLGFVANVLFACEVSEDSIESAGQHLARFKAVSHCYQRRVFTGWDYNLFAMMHGASMGDIQRVIDKFREADRITSFEILPTVKELKKSAVQYHFS